jgi:hypothetical protein
MANPRAEAHFVASGLPDALRPAVSAEAHYIMNVCGYRFSDAVFSAIQGARRNEWASTIAASIAAQVAA